MPSHIAYLCLHAAIGFLIAICFTAALYITDFRGFAEMVNNVDGGHFALVVFAVLNGATFAAAQVGIRVMLMGSEED